MEPNITTITHPPSRSVVQESELAENISDPEALPDYNHPQTILPDHPVETTLPDYSDHPSSSAPTAEYAAVSETDAAGTGGREPAATGSAARRSRSSSWSTIDSAEAAAPGTRAAEAAAGGGTRSIQNEFEVPPSYDAAMKGEV